MAAYEPTSRRPIADLFRATAHLAVSICVRLGIHPDVISWSSLLVAAGAGVCFWRAADLPVLLLAGAALCCLRLWLNMLDGMVALASGKASLQGEIANELPDRFSDMLIFAGIAHSGLCHVASGYWAAMMALVTAYVGTLGQAVAGRREFAGWMSKPWRMAAVMLGACITLAMFWRRDGDVNVGGLAVLDWTCLIVVVGCLQSIVVRLNRIVQKLRESE